MGAPFLYLDPTIVEGINAAKIAGDCYFRIGDSQNPIDTFAIDEAFVDCDDCLASPSPSPSPSPENPCLIEPDCTGHAGTAGVAPSMILSVSNDGTTETVNFGGKVWNLPADNGLRQCVCPSEYQFRKDVPSTVIPSVSGTNWQRWHKAGADGFQISRVFVIVSVFHPTYYKRYKNWRIINTADGTKILGRNVSSLAYSAPPNYSANFQEDFTLPGMNAQTSGGLPTVASYKVLAAMFGSYTSGNKTWKWEQGKNWNL